MILYSQKILLFSLEIKQAIQQILSKEVGLKVLKNRFYDRQERFSYPIKVVIYNHQKMLGYFDPHFYELGFHSCLMHSSKDLLKNIIRHELAHYMTFINYGKDLSAPHGVEFKAFCSKMRWGEEVYRATTCLDDGQETKEAEESATARKVKKLLALSTSRNVHEAEAAMMKSQELLLKHHLSEACLHNEEEIFLLKRILKQKKETAKMRAIARILETFFVSTVYTRGGGHIYLEILGTSVHIEIAEYVAGFLGYELDTLWTQIKMRHAHLKGAVAKNSFFLGIATGYCNKVNALKKEHSKGSHQLIVIEKKLEEARAMAYPHLSSKKSHARYCFESSKLGQQAGKSLNIHTGISQASKNLFLRLGLRTS